MRWLFAIVISFGLVTSPLGAEDQPPSISSISSSVVMSQLDWGIRSLKEVGSAGLPLAEVRQIVDGRGPSDPTLAPAIDAVLGKLEAASSRTFFLKQKEGEPHVSLLSERDRKVLMFTGLGISTVYNTLRTDAKTRARTVLLDRVTDVLDTCAGKLGKESTVACGACVTYGARSFADKYGFADGETVCATALPRDILAFDGAEITDSEFLGLTNVYVSNEEHAKLAKIRIE